MLKWSNSKLSYIPESRTLRFSPTSVCGPDLVARAVLIDMEPKVINRSMRKAAESGRWTYGEASHFSQKQGSGNNWANGWGQLPAPLHHHPLGVSRSFMSRCFFGVQVLRPRSTSQGGGGGAGEAGGGALRPGLWPHGSDERGRRNRLWSGNLRHTVFTRHLPQVLRGQPPDLALRGGGGEHG